MIFNDFKPLNFVYYIDDQTYKLHFYLLYEF